MALMKFCPRCNDTLIPQHEKYCSKCSAKIKKDTREDRREYHRQYNKNKKEEYSFYNSKEWKEVREVAKMNDLNLCQVCLAKGVITYMNVVHHIVEVKEDILLALELDNLICLCDGCHRRVHAIYDRSVEDKQKMTEVLREIKKNGNDIIK